MTTTLDDIMLKLTKLDKLDDLHIAINSIIKNCAELKNRQSSLESKISDLSKENFILKTQFQKINSEFDRFKQQSLNNNLEIAGIPVSAEEIPAAIAGNILSHLGFNDEKIIKDAYRKKSSNTRAGLPPTIIVTIENKGIRDQILKTKRQQTLDTSILKNNVSVENYTNKTNRRLIYINEHLTDFNKYIFKRAKDLRRCGSIVGAWVRNGYIIIKEKENSEERRITHLSELDELR